MNDSNKAIAKRINKELKKRDMSQTDLLEEIIRYKNPNINKNDMRVEVKRKKGNFSTALKGDNNRSLSKEDLYIISKMFGLPLEYIWFGDELKSGFVPAGARYVAYQDNEDLYRSYIAGHKLHEDGAQYPDEFGKSLFEYMGEFESINGYKFFVKYYNLHFDYVRYGTLVYISSDNHLQGCSFGEGKYQTIVTNMMSTLSNKNDTKTFKTIFLNNYSIERFDINEAFYVKKHLFNDECLKVVLQNESFLDLLLKHVDVDLHIFNDSYSKGEIRMFVEPLLYESLFYALDHEKEYESQLFKMLRFARGFNRNQYNFVEKYIKDHKEFEDVSIDEHAPRFLITRRGGSMGNIFVLKRKTSNEELNQIINEIEQSAFNITHIIKKEEKKNDKIRISTPNNPLFIELCKNAFEQNAEFIPTIIHTDKEFTYLQSYESTLIDCRNPDQLKLVIECLNKAQNLVSAKPNKVLVHGNLNGKTIMTVANTPVGLVGWQNCHYGSKYEDRVELLSKIDDYSIGAKYLGKYNELFSIISDGFDHEEKIKLIDKTIEALNRESDMLLEKDDTDGYDSNAEKAHYLKEKVIKLEVFKKKYLK